MRIQKRKTMWYQHFASSYTAMMNCRKHNNADWEEKHSDNLDKLIDLLPSGSGLDYGWSINNDKTGADKIVLQSSYHAMMDNGMYDRRIDFTLTITPSLEFGVHLNIIGNFGKYQDVKDYLYDILHDSITDDLRRLHLENGN